MDYVNQTNRLVNYYNTINSYRGVIIMRLDITKILATQADVDIELDCEPWTFSYFFILFISFELSLLIIIMIWASNHTPKRDSMENESRGD